ncbi:spore cortex-lytic enzyme, partial [Bacillus cereus]
MKDKVNKNKKQNIKDVNTEQNAIYSDPKDAANM